AANRIIWIAMRAHPQNLRCSFESLPFREITLQRTNRTESGAVADDDTARAKRCPDAITVPGGSARTCGSPGDPAPLGLHFHRPRPGPAADHATPVCGTFPADDRRPFDIGTGGSSRFFR